MRNSLVAAVLLFGLVAPGCQTHPALVHLDELTRIHQLEELRPDTACRDLGEMLQHERPWVRARAVRALGRIGSDCANTVLPALGDKETIVQIEAVFALGQMPEAATATVPAIVPMLKHESAEVRIRAVEALGKIAATDLVDAMLPLLEDAEPSVRGAAALGLHRLRARAVASKRPPSTGSDDSMRRRLIAALGAERDTGSHWRITYALSGLVQVGALDVLAQAARAESTYTRIFACRGLASIRREHGLVREQKQLVQRALLSRLQDPDPRVRIEAAAGLGDPSASGRNSAPQDAVAPFENNDVLQALATALQDENPHVAAASALALGHFRNLAPAARGPLSFAESSAMPTVKAAALEAQARLLGESYAGPLEVHAVAEDWRVRSAVARSLRFLGERTAVTIAKGMMQDNDRRVRLATMEALARCKQESAARALVVDAMTERDPATREVGARVLRDIGDASALPDLPKWFHDSPGEAFGDARTEIVRTAAVLGRGQRQTRALLERAMLDPVLSVKKAAHEALVSLGDGEAVPAIRKSAPKGRAALPGREFEHGFLATRPRVEIETGKGAMQFELLPSEAPTHCFNFLHHARAGSYDGRILHRVVPNFVVQGGDARGDGYGNRAWSGGQLRLEIGMVPFLEGVLGMPRGFDRDSGGDQFFVTTLPTPHLDGRYTAFGRLVSGRDVLLKLEIGDRILAVRTLPD